MKLGVENRTIMVPAPAQGGCPLEALRRGCLASLGEGEAPVRVVVSRSDASGWLCELAVLRSQGEQCPVLDPELLFRLRPREYADAGSFNVALLIPTGVGAQIGGHAGDGGAVARLLAGTCDTLITHPNVVNASDINELPDNGLYVEGSVLTRVLMGTAALRPVRSNRVLLVLDKHPDAEVGALSINAGAAARATMGVDIPEVVELAPPVYMKAEFSESGAAVGTVERLERLHELIESRHGQFDALALASVVDLPWSVHETYLAAEGEMVNPWGGVEAILTHAISMLHDLPTAHAPMMESREILMEFTGVVDPRMAAEEISSAFLHCVIKGLHRAPRIVTDPAQFHHPGIVAAEHVDCIVVPDGCLGLPVLAAAAQGIPVIAVRENKTCMRNDLGALAFCGGLHVVETYLEAAGLLTAMRVGVSRESVIRPLEHCRVTTF